MMARVRQRDPEALNAFFEAYFARAYGFVARLVRDADEAEDITQNAFVKIHRAVHTLEPDRDPTSWVFAVVANTVRDYWRSRKFRQSRSDRPLDRTLLADGVTAEDDRNMRNATRALEEGLRDLSEKLRIVVLLRDYEERSYTEIAEILGIAETAARKRHSRALKELRQALNSGGETSKDGRQNA
jgi:RNA polymerase sigma-70 factor (ECF subfamily)